VSWHTEDKPNAGATIRHRTGSTLATVTSADRAEPQTARTTPGIAASAALIHLGRAGALGEVRRVASWHAILGQAGYHVADIRLLPDRRVGPSDVVSMLAGAVRSRPLMPEALAWSSRSVERTLDRLSPALTVFVGGRAFHPSLVPNRGSVVLDYVDRLSASYSGRAGLSRRVDQRLAYRVLSVSARHFEAARPHGVHRVAAGWADAQALAADWVPIVASAAPAARRRDPDVDVLFMGTLSYPPNIDAVRRLVDIWPRVKRLRPDATLLLAGAHPTQEVADIAARHGWELAGDFPDQDAIFARARIAVAPLRFASGIQIKVLEAAAHGLAQVVDPVALAGLGPDFPVSPASDDEQFAAKIVDLLDDPPRAAKRGQQGARFVEERFSVAGWARWVQENLARPIECHAPR
jgi:glycosyltransferase involved in cell wall biosynthesis